MFVGDFSYWDARCNIERDKEQAESAALDTGSSAIISRAKKGPFLLDLLVQNYFADVYFEFLVLLSESLDLH